MSNIEKFSFWTPAELKKGKDKNGADEMMIKGIASSATSDSDGETLQPVGFDYSALLSTGFLNWDHQAKKTSAAIVGEPTAAAIVNGGKDFYIEGRLYPDSEEAQSIYKLSTILEKNSKTRRLGFSIEGQVTERGCAEQWMDKAKTIQNPLWKQIKRARITGVAITPCPKNPNTLMQIMKGESAHELMEEEYDEDIQKALTDSLSKSKCEHIYKDGVCELCGEKEVVKAFTAGGASDAGLLPEHVEGTKNPNKWPLKDTVGSDAVGSYLKKSEIYDLIADRFTTDPEKAKQIFSFVQATNKKLFNMTEVTKESIEKAFDFLNQAADGLAKSKSDKEDDKDEDDKSPLGNSDTPAKKEPGDDKDEKKEKKEEKDEPSEEEVEKAKVAELEKAKGAAKDWIEKGKPKGEAIDELVKSGYSLEVAQGAVESVVAAANASVNGGNVSAGTFAKSEDTDLGKEKDTELVKSITESNELIKSLSRVVDGKFGALGTIMKHTVEQNELLKGEVDALRKSNSALNERLGIVEKTKIPAKSITKVGAAERFIEDQEGKEKLSKSVDAYDLTKSEDVAALGDRMMAECVVAREKNEPNDLLEKAVADLEITKSLPSSVLPYLRAKGIVIAKQGK